MKIMKEETSKKKRRCKKFKGTCESCKIDCPFPFCQHLDCMSCINKTYCPMCEGDCTICPERTICSIWEEN